MISLFFKSDILTWYDATESLKAHTPDAYKYANFTTDAMSFFPLEITEETGITLDIHILFLISRQKDYAIDKKSSSQYHYDLKYILSNDFNATDYQESYTRYNLLTEATRHSEQLFYVYVHKLMLRKCSVLYKRWSKANRLLDISQ